MSLAIRTTSLPSGYCGVRSMRRHATIPTCAGVWVWVYVCVCVCVYASVQCKLLSQDWYSFQVNTVLLNEGGFYLGWCHHNEYNCRVVYNRAFQAANSCWLPVIAAQRRQEWLKMTTGNLLLLVVLAASLGLCSCDCDGFDTDTERSQRCALIYDVLEEALVSNRVNLYRLQDAFFSSTHRNPAWLRVKYVIQNSTESVMLIWSSSTANVLFLELLQPGLLTFFFY